MTIGKNKPQLTRDTEAFVKAVEAQKAPPLYTLSHAGAREVLNRAQSGGGPRPAARISDLEIPYGKDKRRSVPIRIFRTDDNEVRILPVVLYIHGGGWVMGNRDTHDRLAREIAARSGAAVVFVEYTNSPEAQYPEPLEQCYAALQYVVAQADNLRLDPCRVAVAGDSVGGNMAAALTLLSRERGGPEICFQALLYPVTGDSFMTGSYREFADGPWLTRKAMRWFWDAYCPDPAKRKEIYASPIRASLEQLRNVPPALVITDRNDVLRDEGEAYAARLMRAGVPVAAARYDGTIHDFLMLDALAGTAPARAALEQVAAALRCALCPEA